MVAFTVESRLVPVAGAGPVTGTLLRASSGYFRSKVLTTMTTPRIVRSHELLTNTVRKVSPDFLPIRPHTTIPGINIPLVADAKFARDGKYGGPQLTEPRPKAVAESFGMPNFLPAGRPKSPHEAAR